MEEGAFEQGQVDIQAEKGPRHARQRFGQSLRGMNKATFVWKINQQKEWKWGGGGVERVAKYKSVSFTPLKSKVGT